MDNVRTKLAHCFSLVFPAMDPTLYPEASADTMSEWDSITQVTLLTTIGEEFNIDIDYEEFEGATSFASLAERLTEKTSRYVQ